MAVGSQPVHLLYEVLQSHQRYPFPKPSGLPKRRMKINGRQVSPTSFDTLVESRPAGEMNPRRGFADDSLVLIHGEYYRTSDTANEKRRPILMMAWYTEFADILLGNDKLGLTAESYQRLQQKGAADIVKDIVGYLKHSFSVFTHPRISRNQAKLNHDYFVSILCDLKEKRNHGIHKKIGHSHYLEEILALMINFCQLLQNFGMASPQSDMFADECCRQLQNLGNFRHLY